MSLWRAGGRRSVLVLGGSGGVGTFAVQARDRPHVAAGDTGARGGQRHSPDLSFASNRGGALAGESDPSGL